MTTGSPKQRWADLSEEDDELDTMELSRFGDFFLPSEMRDAAQGDKVENTVPKSVPGRDDMMNRISYGEGPPALPGRYDQMTSSSFGEAPQPLPAWMCQDSMAVSQCCPINTTPEATVTRVFMVQLHGIPPKLCNDACLDTILWASGVQRFALGYHSKKSGHIAINFASLDAAMHCSNHFRACSWASGKLHVDVVLPSSGQIGASRRNSRDHQGYATVGQALENAGKQSHKTRCAQ